MRRVREWYREHEVGLAMLAVMTCLVALAYVWWPSEAQADAFRTITINKPPLGHWIQSEVELNAVQAEAREIVRRAEAMPRGSYTAEVHHKDQKRLLYLNKSLFPVEGGRIIDGRLVTPVEPSISIPATTGREVNVIRSLELELQRDMNSIVDVFVRESPIAEREKAAALNKAAHLSEISMMQKVESDYHAWPFLAWMLHTHLTSMGVVFLLFLLRAQFIEQKRRILLLDPLKTAFWMLFWPVGVWVYPTDDPIQVVRLVRHRLAMATSFLFTVAVPNFALAQSGHSGEKKDKQDHTLVLTFEGVDRYHGMAVGEIFIPEPAPRVMGRYTYITPKGSFYLDSWNSVGRGFNNEADFGGGWARSGWDISYTHFFIRGGDIEQVAVAKSGGIKVGKAKIPLGARLIGYFGTKASSPPGGVVSKFSSALSHRLGLGVGLTHKVALGIDNNPFGLGNGWSAIGFYTIEAGWKKAYLAWNASAPIRGQDNTTRGFRQSLSGGYRHAWAW